jgi:hypothetical protein
MKKAGGESPGFFHARFLRSAVFDLLQSNKKAGR